MSETTNTALAGIPAQAVAPVPAPPSFGDVFGREDRPMVCSFDLKTPAGRELLQKCEEASDESVRDIVGSEIQLQHVYAKVIDYASPATGEVIPLLRICLVTPTGQVHACCADGVRESLLRLMAGHGMPPWKTPVRVQVKQKATKKGFVRLVLLEVFPTPKGGAK